MDPVGPDRQRVGGVAAQEGEAAQGGAGGGAGQVAGGWARSARGPSTSKGQDWRCVGTFGVPCQGRGAGCGDQGGAGTPGTLLLPAREFHDGLGRRIQPRGLRVPYSGSAELWAPGEAWVDLISEAGLGGRGEAALGWGPARPPDPTPDPPTPALTLSPGADPQGHPAPFPGHRVAAPVQRHGHASQEPVLGAAQDVLTL